MSSNRYCKVVAIVQARLTSTRLPKKILKKIGDKRIIDRVIENVRKAKLVDEVVVASPHPIPGIKTFIGDERDVLKRYRDCAYKHEADVIVRITADCPFIDPEVIDMAINYFFKHGTYTCFAPIDGKDVEVFDYFTLVTAHLNAKNKYDREHVTPYMRRASKLSIDTVADLKKARAYNELVG